MQDASATAWLELEIEPTGAELRVTARGSRDERPAPHVFGAGPLPQAFAAAVGAAASRGRPLGTSLPDARLLHRALFGGGVEPLRARLAEVSGGEPLLLRLLVRDPELQSVPWEALCAPDSAMGFLGTSPGLLPVRGVTSAEPWAPGAVRGALRVLCVSPDGAEVTGTLRDALAERVRDGDVEWLEPIVGERTEVRSLFQALGREPLPHVLHFLGHGQLRDGVPGLLVGGDEDDPTWLPVELLAQQLVPAFRGPLRLVVLEACEGARPSVFASAAEALTRAGAAAVVAHLWPVRASTARLCSEQLYRALVGHHERRGDVAAALNDGRRAMLGALGGSAEAFSPVLYLRGTNGRVFEFGDRESPGASMPVARPRPVAPAPRAAAAPNESTLDVSRLSPAASARPAERLALLIAWAPSEPERVGEVALFEPDAGVQVLGRGEPPDGGAPRVVFCRQRPGATVRTDPLTSPGLSREQLRVRVDGSGLRVERIGKRRMVFRGEEVESCQLRPGDTLLLRGQLLLHCTSRPPTLEALPDVGGLGAHEFGEPDEHGIVGESPAAWRLRDRIAWAAASREHALILGPSGAGKELTARAIHARSRRGRAPFVARSAATIPVGFAETELFGNVRGYPDAAMPERAGLVGAAHGGTLFLDELGELPAALQPRLLRVLDEGGEYHPVGASAAKRADLRLLGATNREPTSLSPDLAARIVLRVTVPGLDERRDDIPLLLRHLLRRAAERSPEAATWGLASSPEARGPARAPEAAEPSPGRTATAPKGAGDGPVPAAGAGLVTRLLSHAYSAHMRELNALLWKAIEDGETEGE